MKHPSVAVTATIKKATEEQIQEFEKLGLKSSTDKMEKTYGVGNYYIHLLPLIKGKEDNIHLTQARAENNHWVELSEEEDLDFEIVVLEGDLDHIAKLVKEEIEHFDVTCVSKIINE